MSTFASCKQKPETIVTTAEMFTASEQGYVTCLRSKVHLLEIQKCVSFQYFNFLTAGLGNIKKI